MSKERIFHFTCILTIAMVVVSFHSPPTILAADGEETVEVMQEQTEAANKALGDKRFFVMPIPIVNPTIGAGLGAMAMYLFEAGENAPPSSLTFGGFYTDSDSWAGAVGTQIYFKDDKYRMPAWVGFFDINVDFYGIGNEAGDRGIPVPISQSGPFFAPSFLFRIADNLYLGPRYRLLTIETVIDKTGLPAGHPGQALPDVFTVKSSGLGVILNYDKKDNKFYPHNGSFLNVDTNFTDESLNSDTNYQQYEVGYNLYREIGEQQILAWRATGCFTDGDTPYYDLCMFGGEFDSMRGYVGGQYRDDMSLTTQLEYRWRFYKKWGLVAFGGIGQVASNLSEFTTDNILPSAGLGVRFRASEEQRVNLSIDYARGKDSNAWYFRIGEAF